MSDLRSSVLKSRIARLPHLPAIHPGAEAEEESGDGAGQSSSSMPPPPSLGAPRRPLRSKDPTGGAFAPISSEDCFSQALEVDVNYPTGSSSRSATFRVYYTPPLKSGPSSGTSRSAASSVSTRAEAIDVDLDNLQAPVLMSGGDDDEDDADDTDSSGGSGTVFVLHHGAGFGGLSYALVAREITRQTKGQVGVLAFDCRGHGRTRVEPPESSKDTSLFTLSSDLILLLKAVFGTATWPKLLFVGHSMGGSVVTKTVERLLSSSSSPDPLVSFSDRSTSPSITGLAVLDVVEGTALDALEGMTAIVKAQPTGFASVEDAIRWHVDTGVLMNVESARRSVPSLVVPNPAFREDGSGDRDDGEEEEEVLQGEAEGTLLSTPVPSSQHKLVWKADLLSTAPYWRGWFEGMSQRFLTARSARLLLLAGTDRLDKDLMIGQMQGKYQLVVFPEVGHCLHEDAPERTAQVLVEFWRRNQLSVPIAKLKHARKVGQ
ncbi:Protein phosphatase methylesterase 1 [Tilletia horrida]|uniref:Protein phosphatase methylesterase 1 n=1 Tax=Tilletia horrida TaxID=155126 RepID=A0AAN6JTT5_9BASI|nr:Protein phosphatase methylesterase 1 [Tilletia horrida]KAK0569399.1 Protein phosphatase methylesterase 1 [Tilletia horrida]